MQTKEYHCTGHVLVVIRNPEIDRAGRLSFFIPLKDLTPSHFLMGADDELEIMEVGQVAIGNVRHQFCLFVMVEIPDDML
jgi:hypothetical protein